jgi:hypothetical protein
MMSKRNGSTGLYKRVLALKDNGSEADPEVPGLTYEARTTTQGLRQYGQLRYRHPVTGKWTTKGKLGRVPTPFELEALRLAHLDAFEAEGQGGTLIIRDDEIAFEAIRAGARTAIAMLRSGVDPKSAMGPQGLTVAQAIEHHLAEPREEPLSPVTVEQYRRFLNVYLKPVANVPLRRLDSAALMKLKARLHEAGPSLPSQVLRVLKLLLSTGWGHGAPEGALPPAGPRQGGGVGASACPYAGTIGGRGRWGPVPQIAIVRKCPRRHLRSHRVPQCKPGSLEKQLAEPQPSEGRSG